MSGWKTVLTAVAVLVWGGGTAYAQTLTVWSGVSGFDPRNRVIQVMQGLLAEGRNDFSIKVRKDIPKNAEDVVAAVAEGAIDLGVVGQSAFYPYGEIFRHDNQPWLVSDPQASRELDRVALPLMTKALEDALPSVALLASVTGNPLGLATNKRIKRLEDLKGADLLLPRHLNATGLRVLGLNPLKDERYRNEKATAPFLSGRKAKAVVVSLSRVQEFFERRGGTFIDLQMAFPKALIIVNRKRLNSLAPKAAKLLTAAVKLAAYEVRREQKVQLQRLRADANKRGISIIPFREDFAEPVRVMAETAQETASVLPEPVAAVQASVGGPITGYCIKVSVPFGTNRKPEAAQWPTRGYFKDRASGKEMVFGGQSDAQLHLGAAVVSLPTRTLGAFAKLGKPCGQLGADPKEPYLLSVKNLTAEDFVDRLGQTRAELLDRRSVRIGREEAGKEALKDAFVYVHGYRNSFARAVETAALLSRYLGDRVQPVVFSWPSADSVWQYGGDGERVEEAGGEFEAFVDRLSQSDVYGSYHLVAHSMGNRLVIPAAARFDPALTPRLGALLALNSDLSLKRQEALDEEAAKRMRNASIYVASDDWALTYSQIVNGEARAGQLDGGTFPYDPSFEPVDVTGRATDLFSHGGHLGGLVERDMLQAMVGPEWTPLSKRHLVREQVDGQRVLWGFPFAP